MTMKETEILEKFKKELQANLSTFIDEKPSKEDIIEVCKKTMIAYLEAEMFGGEVISVKTGWDKMTPTDKSMWFICNKLFPIIGKKARALYDDAYIEYYENLFEEEDKPPFNVKLPLIFHDNPKTVIITDVSIKLNTPIEYMEFKGIKTQLEENK